MKLTSIAVGLFLVNFASVMAERLVGGISNDEKESGEEVQNLLTSLKSEIKTAALAAYTTSDGSNRQEMEEHIQNADVTPLGHKTQVVAGTNYFVRTKIGDHIFHVRIYRDLKRNASLAKVIGPKKESDPIEYF